jgi:hypothetical protein
LTAGLGGVVEFALLRALPNRTVTRDGRDSSVFDCEVILSFTSRSVHEPVRVWHSRGELQLTTFAVAGVLALWRKNLLAVA